MMSRTRVICKQSARCLAARCRAWSDSVTLDVPAGPILFESVPRPPLAGQTWSGAQFAAALDLVKMALDYKKMWFVICISAFFRHSSFGFRAFQRQRSV